MGMYNPTDQPPTRTLLIRLNVPATAVRVERDVTWLELPAQEVDFSPVRECFDSDEMRDLAESALHRLAVLDALRKITA